MIMDDAFLRTVAALQANLKVLESQQDSLSEIQDMQALRRLKSELADYIAGHAENNELPHDPLSTIGPRLEALASFFQRAESESRRLLSWRKSWLDATPRVSLADLQHAVTELAELEQQLPALQETLRGMLDPRDWNMEGSEPEIHPELRSCTRATPDLHLPAVKPCAEFYDFSRGTGKLHEQVQNHLTKMDKRLDELQRLHAIHLSSVTEAEGHLAKENFRSAEKVLGTMGNVPFADIDYSKAGSGLEKQKALFESFSALNSAIEERLAKGEIKAVLLELESLRGEVGQPNSELGAETSVLAARMDGVLASYIRRRTRRRMVTATVLVLGLAGFTALTYHLTKAHEEAQARAAREEAQAKAKLAFELQTNRAGSVANISFAGKLLMAFAYCPAGTFTMGSPTSEEGHSSEEKQAVVSLTKGFWLAKTELTQAQWQAVMGGNPSHFKGDNLPVENVTWHAAQKFIGLVNASGVIPAGWKMALPTEAQWEHACRAGNSEPYVGFSLDELAWYNDNSENKTHEVGAKKANAWGLYDMHGNVWEWCADWYGYELPGGTDPAGVSSGEYRVSRGGSSFSVASACRAASRTGNSPIVPYYRLGLRPALVQAN
jgi:formylglycine-generating enzyme required for sulfatase activity